MLESREVETMIGRSPATLRRLADALPIAPAVKGRARSFSTGEMVLILAALALEERGFLPPAARSIVRAIEPELARIVGDDNREAWLIAWPEPALEAGVRFSVAHSKSAGLDLVLAQDDVDAVMICDLRKIVRRALTTILLAVRASKENADVA